MTQSHFYLTLTGKNADPLKGGLSEVHPSTERQKKTPHQSGWVRGHHKDGGGYTKEMPKYVTGKTSTFFTY